MKKVFYLLVLIVGFLIWRFFTPPRAAGVYTWHNDNVRTGQNRHEKILTPSNVTPARFGKLFSFPVDGALYAQPLYVPHVVIPGQGRHNVVYLATEHDSVYAFDADSAAAAPLWQVSFTNGKTFTSVPSEDLQCHDISPEIGITGTPVIDPSAGVLYVVVKTKEIDGHAATYVQRLHALDIRTGNERLGGPVVLEASIPGRGSGNDGRGHVLFNALRENQRPALLLSRGVVYIAFASYCDQEPYHGWVLGYDAATVRQVMAYNDTPNGAEGGIWQSGGGPAADARGDIFFVSGNGTFDANAGGSDYGDSFIRLTPSGVVADYFTPHDQQSMSETDLDLGSSGHILLPDQPGPHTHLMISAGKNSAVYLVDRDHMGHFNSQSDDQIPQALQDAFSVNGSFTGGAFTAPVLWNDTIYYGAVVNIIQGFRLQSGHLNPTPVTQSTAAYPFPGAAMTISANGSKDGVLWAVQMSTTSDAAAVLHAYDATDLRKELYRSDQAGARDALDRGVKFVSPTVVNGKVYVCGQRRLTVLGLR